MELTSQSPSIRNVGRGERWISLVAGGAFLLRSMRRLRQRPGGGLATALLGGAILRRALTGHCDLYQALGWSSAERAPGVQRNLPLRVDRSIVIDRPPAEIYRSWRNLENLPRFMTHLESVTVHDPRRSHWVAKAPAGATVEWDAKIINEIENELIAWESLPGAEVAHAGSVHFKSKSGGNRTELRVVLRYDPPAGVLGATVAELFGQEPSQQIAHDLRRFKELVETQANPSHVEATGRAGMVGSPAHSRSFR